MSYKLVIFDFDGTIADTSEGILDSHRFALSAMGIIAPSDNVLRRVIGAQLLKTYLEEFKLAEAQAREAVKIYRKRYAEIGIHKAVLYPGFKGLISEIKKKGYKIGVATLKAEHFAECMLEEMGIKGYFDSICGMNEHDDLDKADLVIKCCANCNVDKNLTILIGDSNNDLSGAREAGVAFVGVTYGFGFQPGQSYDFKVAHSVEEIIEYL